MPVVGLVVIFSTCYIFLGYIPYSTHYPADDSKSAMEIIAGTYHYQDLSFATSNLANGMLVPAPALQFGQFFEFFQHAAPHCKWRLY